MATKKTTTAKKTTTKGGSTYSAARDYQQAVSAYHTARARSADGESGYNVAKARGNMLNTRRGMQTTISKTNGKIQKYDATTNKYYQYGSGSKKTTTSTKKKK